MAASSSSIGMVMKNWRSRKVPNAEPKKTGHDQGQVGVEPAEGAEKDELGDEGHLAGDHHAAQPDQEHRLSAGEPEPREGVGGQ